jgi:membrane associated rhomboid family serine protease
MSKHTISGIVAGTLFGVLAAWIAMSSALHAGGLVAVAGILDGMMGGLCIGWLIGMNVAEGTVDEAEAESKQVAENEPVVRHTEVCEEGGHK